MGLDIAVSGVLALTGPAAYWVCGGGNSFTPGIVWAIMWAHAAASIVHVFVRLSQKDLPERPSSSEALQMAMLPLFLRLANITVAATLACAALVPWLTVLAFSVCLIDGIEGVLNPPVGRRTRQIGFRQLGVSLVFVILVTLGYAL